ncbi:GPI biosynthesis protein Pig-F [Tricharina praecox]|uniref:GPI biosynthesis protein Pig-F n=1 Tax=Tricharina praecox TaxID=43433 RepID=UPI00221F752B|nr:GPI biosynthesis protein Pig-F [Tricharina praecox]KAI5852006.1 GPI biosynthesis protein Pig-F [Tricharina praecox]
MPSASAPTPFLPSALTTASTHLHTVSLLSSLALHLPDLIASPSLTLTRTALPLAALQTVYLVLTSTSTTPTTPKAIPTTPKPASSAPKPKKTVRAKKAATVPFAILTALAFTLVVGAPLLFLLLVAFGAPVTSHHAETLSTAVHLALLTIYPLSFTRGWDAGRWREILALTGEVDEAVVGALGACVGAWAGAVPIPLDWDREWQKWPVTILVGAYAGYALGKMVGGVWAGRKMPC